MIWWIECCAIECVEWPIQSSLLLPKLILSINDNDYIKTKVMPVHFFCIVIRNEGEIWSLWTEDGSEVLMVWPTFFVLKSYILVGLN